MSEWKIVRLGDVLIQQDKSKIKAGEGIDDGVYPFYTCSNELTKQINTAQYKGPALIFGTGGKASVHFCSGSFSTSTDCLVYKTSKEVNLSLVNKYLRKNMYLLENGFKGAGLKHISREYIANIEISLPEILEQNKLDSQFYLIESSITNHKKMLEKYDTLIKSRFIEMFGDPVQNPMGWEISNLGKFIENANNGMARRGNDKNGKIVLRLVELQRGFLDYSECNRIEIKSNEEKYLLKNNDFLFARVNGNPDNVGRCCYYKDIGENVYHNDHIIRIHFDENRLNEYFLNTLLNSDYGKSEFKKYIKTSAGQYTIAQDGISSAQIPVPPLELQNDFAAFVQQIDKSKFAVQKSLEKAETLYKSLMQEYFN